MRLDHDSTRCRGQRFTLVDEAHGNAHARQFQRGCEAGRPCTDNQGWIPQDMAPFGNEWRNNVVIRCCDARAASDRSGIGIEAAPDAMGKIVCPNRTPRRLCPDCQQTYCRAHFMRVDTTCRLRRLGTVNVSRPSVVFARTNGSATQAPAPPATGP
jgi:hypothetical protein